MFWTLAPGSTRIWTIASLNDCSGTEGVDAKEFQIALAFHGQGAKRRAEAVRLQGAPSLRRHAKGAGRRGVLQARRQVHRVAPNVVLVLASPDDSGNDRSCMDADPHLPTRRLGWRGFEHGPPATHTRQ